MGVFKTGTTLAIAPAASYPLPSPIVPQACQYAPLCQFVNHSLGDVLAHEMTCIHRTVLCLWPSCQQPIPVGEHGDNVQNLYTTHFASGTCKQIFQCWQLHCQFEPQTKKRFVAREWIEHNHKHQRIAKLDGEMNAAMATLSSFRDSLLRSRNGYALGVDRTLDFMAATHDFITHPIGKQTKVLINTFQKSHESESALSALGASPALTDETSAEVVDDDEDPISS